MRICFISVGTFTHIGAYLDYFRQTGHDVLFVSLSPSPERQVPTYNVGLGKKYSEREGKWKYPISMLRARRLIKKLKPDIVHAHYATSGGLTTLACGFHPAVVTVHGSDLTVGIKSRVWRPLLKRIFEYSDCVNTVSKNLQSMVLSMGISPEKIENLTLGIDTEKFSFAERTKIEQSRVLRFLCTRRLESVFDHSTVLHALAQLKKKGIKFQMTFVGNGSLLGELKKLANDLNLNDYVSFIGPVHNGKLPEVLGRHDVYLSASLRDGTSLSLLEAMATGLFPIVSNIKANSDWLRHGNDGLLHKVGDADDLANCILQLLSKPDIVAKAVQRNRQLVIEQADRNKNMKRLESIYEDLINKSRTGTI